VTASVMATAVCVFSYVYQLQVLMVLHCNGGSTKLLHSGPLVLGMGDCFRAGKRSWYI